jgi:general secretion pathway protein G
MFAIRKNVKKGFTLVEILIVVIILGILAAIVIPQFTNASEDARKSSLTSQLQTIRSQVELYKLQHRDEYPTADGTLESAWNWAKMTARTTEEGTISLTGQFGPYLQAAPKNSLSGKEGVFVNDDELAFGAAFPGAAATDGWVITPSGKIFASSKGGGFIYNEADKAAENNAN